MSVAVTAFDNEQQWGVCGGGGGVCGGVHNKALAYPVDFALVCDRPKRKPSMRPELLHRVAEHVTQLNAPGIVSSHQCAIH
jgi:hypothetical protein